MEEQKEEVLTEEDEYAKLETEKLLKRKRKRKLITSISMAFALAVAVVIILLGTIPAKLKPACIDDGYVTIRFSDKNYDTLGGVFSKNETSQKANYDKFKTLLNESFNQTYLSAIFNGSLSSEEYEENWQDWSSARTELIENQSKFVSLEYESAVTLKDRDGKQYMATAVKTTAPLTYTNVWIAISDKEEFVDTRIYFNISYPGNDNKLIACSVRANTSKLYNAFAELVGWTEF